jgi:hypothetical protein
MTRDRGAAIVDLLQELIREAVEDAMSKTIVSLEPRQSPEPAAIWMKSQEAADRAGLDIQTVLRSAGAGKLHGYQRAAPNGPWRFHADCVDDWIRGEKCEHQDSPVRRIRAS